MKIDVDYFYFFFFPLSAKVSYAYGEISRRTPRACFDIMHRAERNYTTHAESLIKYHDTAGLTPTEAFFFSRHYMYRRLVHFFIPKYIFLGEKTAMQITFTMLRRWKRYANFIASSTILISK